MTLKDQIHCVEREIRLREACYPRFITAGRLTEGKAKLEIIGMKAVLRTLQEAELRSTDNPEPKGDVIPF